jgi:hypothetical protein
MRDSDVREHSIATMATFELVYFNGKGLAEVSRPTTEESTCSAMGMAR